MSVVEELDQTQQRRAWLAFPFAIYKKFGDDRAGASASLLAYYTFFSIFPLMLVAVTVLGFVLHSHPQLQAQAFHSVLNLFPIIGSQDPVHPLTGSLFALIIGSVLALWSGLGVASQAQAVFNTLYSVPRKDWPGFLPRILRSLEAVVVGGTGFLLTTAISGAITGAGSYGLTLGIGLRVLAAIVAIALNTALFTLLFNRLTVRELRWRDTLPGACLAAASWYALQLGGTALVAHKLKGAEHTYGTFAAVIGLLTLFHLQAQLTLYAVEINVVRTDHLWPRGIRSFTNTPTTEADHRAYSSYAERNRFADPAHEQVDVDFTGPTSSDPDKPADQSR